MRLLGGALLCARVFFGGCYVFAAGPVVDLSTPEKTIEAYYHGYKIGSRALINATFLTPGEISPLGLGVATEYRIIRKTPISASRITAPRAGDLEVVTSGILKWPDGELQKMETTFILRQVDGAWKIVEYDSEVPGLPPPN